MTKLNGVKCYYASDTLFEYFHKQPPKVFFKKGVLRNFAKLTGKHLCQRFFFNKVAGLRCFPVNFAKFLRTPFLQNTSGGCFCCLICYFIVILVYIERKWLLMRNLATIFSLSYKSCGKFRCFNAIMEVSKCW